MFKLTIELNSAQELADFVVKLGVVPATAQVEEVKTEPKKKKATDKLAEVKTAKEEVVVRPDPAVPELPPTLEVQKPPFDRQGAILLATQTIKELTEAGIAGPDLAQHLAKIYAQTGCPIGIKISQLADEQLEKFIPAFIESAESLKTTNTAFI